MKWTFSISCRLRFFFPATIWMGCAVFLLLFGLLFNFIIHQQRQLLIAQTKTDLYDLFNEHRSDLAEGIIAGHPLDLNFAFQQGGLAAKLSGVWVMDSSGHLIGSKGGPRTISRSSGPPVNQLSTMTALGSREPRQTQSLLYCAIDHDGKRLGYFGAGLDDDAITAAAHRRLMLSLMGIYAVLLAGAAYLHFLSSHSVLKPLALISSSLGNIRHGRFGKPVTLVIQNELGDIIERVNALSDALKSQQRLWTEKIQACETQVKTLEQTQANLARLNADLENIVEARTRELQNLQNTFQDQHRDILKAQQENRMLEKHIHELEKKSIVGKLARNAAHELNNMLAPLMSYPELILLDLPASSPIRSKVENILIAARNASSLVQDLSALAGIDSSPMRSLNINQEVVAAVMNGNRYKEICRNQPCVSVETHLSEDIMQIKGHAVALKKMLLNMTAYAFSTVGGNGRITMSTENRYVDQPAGGLENIAEGDYVVMRIVHDAKPLDPRAMDHLFEPFAARNDTGRGVSGLGLAVVSAIVKDHQGFIHVQPTPETGTCFDLYFPADRREIDAERITIPIDRFMGRGETVLVIDDIKEQREIASKLLTRLNYKVFTVESGEKAVEFLKTRPVDILMLDMIMDPGMDGLETYIKILEGHPGQKAIIASGFSMNERVQSAQRLGAGPYIRKPYTLEKIALGLKSELVQ